MGTRLRLRPNRAPSTLTLAGLKEEGFLRRFVQPLAKQGPRLLLGAGDDCAILPVQPRAQSVFTMDLLVEGTHFTADTMGGARRLGFKALAVNVSDIASMGARPAVALLGLSAPPQTPVRFLGQLYQGLKDACRRYGCVLAGGDTVRSDCLCLSVALLGELEGRAPAARRDGARTGQRVYCTGWPGESGAGLSLLIGALRDRSGQVSRPVRDRLIRRHQAPEPRVEAGVRLRRLASRRRAGLAMIDISDGLAHEADLIARASKVGIEIDAARLPVSPALNRLRDGSGADPVAFILHGGEDFELLFATELTLAQIQADFRRAGIDTPVHEIGRVVARRGVFFRGGDGRIRPLRHAGFEHFAQTPALDTGRRRGA